MLAHRGRPELRLTGFAMTYDALYLLDWVEGSISSTKAIAGSARDSVVENDIAVGAVVGGLGRSRVRVGQEILANRGGVIVGFRSIAGQPDLRAGGILREDVDANAGGERYADALWRAAHIADECVLHRFDRQRAGEA